MSLENDCRNEFEVYYHGSSSSANISHKLLPPVESGIISEKGRKKNLQKIFFTKDKGLAKIYSGRACRSYGGEPKLYRVVNPINVECLDDRAGASVFFADYAFAEEISF